MILAGYTNEAGPKFIYDFCLLHSAVLPKSAQTKY